MSAHPSLGYAGAIAEPETPAISIVIATRNRGGMLAEAVESLVGAAPAGSKTSLELIVVDQSHDGSTEIAVAPYLLIPQVHYIRTPTQGLGAARNVGVVAARSEWIAFTDDDCTAGGNWLEELRRAFELDARIGMVFGNVIAGPHDGGAGFIPSYVRKGSNIARSLAGKHRVEGIGACMALRKSVWLALGGFDPLLGAGSRFHAAEELDLVLRALEAGYWVYETDRAEVAHRGFRRHAERSGLAYGYCFGIGAAYIKHLKCARWRVLLPLFQLACRWTFGRPRVSYGQPPDRMSRLRGFLDGIAAGWRTPVDRRRVLYHPREDS